MNQLPALLKREFQEHRNMLLYVPLAISAIIILLQLLALAAVGLGEDGWMSVTVHNEDGEERTLLLGIWYDQLVANLAVMNPAEQAEMMEVAYFGVSWLLFGTMWFLVLFYLLGTLYDDRRDRSILFWKSMPVSDALTVASKLLTAVIVIPAIYFACIFVVQTVFLVTSTLSLDSQTPETVVDLVFDPVRLLTRWFEFIGFHLVTIAWCAPFYAWLLLVSAWAKSVPLMWAIGIPVSLAAVDALMVSGELGGFLKRHTFPVGLDDEHFLSLGQTIVAYGMSWEFPIALLIAAIFVYLTIRIRGKADEI